jgi:hypothetical protein
VGSGRAPEPLPGWCGCAVSSVLRRSCGGAVYWRPAIGLQTQSVVVGEVGHCVGVIRVFAWTSSGRVCDETEPRCSLRALNGVWNNPATWNSDQTKCIMRTNSFLSSLFLSFDTRMPYLQIISPDLSVTVFVMLHYLTLTLASPKRHSLTVRPKHTLSTFQNKELRPQTTHQSRERTIPNSIHTCNIQTKNKQLLEIHRRSPHEVVRRGPSQKPAQCQHDPR